MIMYSCTFTHDDFSSRKYQHLPTTFKKGNSQGGAVLSNSGQTRAFTYDRDILCLPSGMADGNTVQIPRAKVIRESLARNGLIGKIRLSSSMTEDEIYDEIRCVFSAPMNYQKDFPFKILQPSGGNSKSLIVPSLSPTYQWTASAVAGKLSKMPIYILAEDDLKLLEEENESNNTMITVPSTKITESSNDITGPTDTTGPPTDMTGPSTDTTGPSTDMTGPSTNTTGPSTDIAGPSTSTTSQGLHYDKYLSFVDLLSSDSDFTPDDENDEIPPLPPALIHNSSPTDVAHHTRLVN
jgi:hypothetical protein